MSATKSKTSYYVCAAIGLFLMFFFGKLVQPFAGITPEGVSMLGIFFGVLVVTIFTGETFWPAIMGLFAMIICGYTKASALLATWFGNVTIQQIIWVMALTGAVTESGAVNVLARKVLMIKSLQGHPVRLVTTLFLTVLVGAALVSSPTTMLLLFYPILDTICEMCGVEKDSDLKRELLLGVYIAAMGAYVLPFKGVHLSSIAIISGIMEASGLVFNSAAYLIVATLVVLLFVLGYIACMVFAWKTDLTALKNFDAEKMNLKKEELTMTGRQKILLGFMIFGIFFLLVSMFLPKGSAILNLYNTIGSTWIWIFLFAVLCMMRDTEGKPFINGVKLPGHQGRHCRVPVSHPGQRQLADHGHSLRGHLHHLHQLHQRHAREFYHQRCVHPAGLCYAEGGRRQRHRPGRGDHPLGHVRLPDQRRHRLRTAVFGSGGGYHQICFYQGRCHKCAVHRPGQPDLHRGGLYREVTKLLSNRRKLPCRKPI